jgi:light-regulated signal transduction histidine kinase (bacteriophytochrome)
MDSMIVSLLDYSRVGRKNDPKKMVASRDALDEALDFLEPTILDRHAEIVVSGRWPLLVASYDELVRLFQNLVGNAIKYTPLNRSPWVAIDSDHNDQSWHISVRDHGIGFEMSQSGRLFQIFSRIEHRSEYEGNGVGLALCRKIIEHHGGEIGCESAGTDRGSHFHFTLPLDGGEPPS